MHCCCKAEKICAAEMVCVPVFLPGPDPVFLFEGEIKKKLKTERQKNEF